MPVSRVNNAYIKNALYIDMPTCYAHLHCRKSNLRNQTGEKLAVNLRRTKKKWVDNCVNI